MKEAEAGLPPPDRRYCSPLSRALDTCDIMFDKIYNEHPAAVLVIEVSLPILSCCVSPIGREELPWRKRRPHLRQTKLSIIHQELQTEFRDWNWIYRTRRALGCKHPRVKTRYSASRTWSHRASFWRWPTSHLYIPYPSSVSRYWYVAVISITAHGGFITGFQSAIGRKHLNVPTGGRAVASPLGSSRRIDIILTTQEYFQCWSRLKVWYLISFDPWYSRGPGSTQWCIKDGLRSAM